MINSLSKTDDFTRTHKKLIKTHYFTKVYKHSNKNIKVVKLEIFKVKTWFWNKDLSSLDSIN